MWYFFKTIQHTGNILCIQFSINEVFSFNKSLFISIYLCIFKTKFMQSLYFDFFKELVFSKVTRHFLIETYSFFGKKNPATTLLIKSLHTCEPSGGRIFLPILRVPSVPPVNFQNLPHVKKIKYNKILTYILRSIFLEIPHLELPRWWKTLRDMNDKGECHI